MKQNHPFLEDSGIDLLFTFQKRFFFQMTNCAKFCFSLTKPMISTMIWRSVYKHLWSNDWAGTALSFHTSLNVIQWSFSKGNKNLHYLPLCWTLGCAAFSPSSHVFYGSSSGSLIILEGNPVNRLKIKKSWKQDVKYQPGQNWTNAIWFSLLRKQSSDKQTAVPIVWHILGGVWSLWTLTCPSAVRFVFRAVTGEGEGEVSITLSCSRESTRDGLRSFLVCWL